MPRSKNKVKKSDSTPSKKQKQSSQQQVNSNPPPSTLNWPLISTKSNLQIESIYQDHIVIIPSFFTQKECTNMIDFINKSIPLESANPSLIPKKGEAYRDNDRFSIEDTKSNCGPTVTPIILPENFSNTGTEINLIFPSFSNNLELLFVLKESEMVFHY